MRERERIGRGRVTADDDGWQTVKGRRGRSLTTYFFSHFPDNFDAKALWGVFKLYGDVAEVVIPTKRNKEGLRFGFARFWEVADPKQLERKLDNIIIGCNKMYVNLPRFKKELAGIGCSRKDSLAPNFVPRKVGQKKPLEIRSKMAATYEKKMPPNQESKVRSYRDALKDGKGNVEVPKGHVEIEKVIEIDEEVAPWLKNSLIGKLRRVDLLNSIPEMFVLEGIICVRVRYMGDNFVLITGVEGMNVKEIWEQADDWFNDIFEAIYPWSPKSMPKQRIIWLRCEGISLHLWKVSFFQELIKDVGEIVAVDSDTVNFAKVDAARLCIRTPSMEPIFVHYKMKIKENSYNIRLMEELPTYGACDGCCKDQSGSSEGSESSSWSMFGDGTPPASPSASAGGDGMEVEKSHGEDSQVVRETLMNLGKVNPNDGAMMIVNGSEDNGGGHVVGNDDLDKELNNAEVDNLSKGVDLTLRLNPPAEVGLVHSSGPSTHQLPNMPCPMGDPLRERSTAEIDLEEGGINPIQSEGSFVVGSFPTNPVQPVNQSLQISSSLKDGSSRDEDRGGDNFSGSAINLEGLAVAIRDSPGRCFPRIVSSESNCSSSTNSRASRRNSVSRTEASQAILSTGNSISDSGMVNCNGIFWLRHRVREAKRI